ncbi:MAG: HD domain-containing protein [Flavobacteriaceae bacterium]|nr:HD domain-containing protein [Flavobacteriaceae bacterium]
MKKINKLKIFNDPIYGFIRIPSALIFDLIEDNSFQRLRRISQMGLSSLVYPGALHTRFQHALGSMYLMQKAIRSLRFKGVEINEEEEQGLLIAILLHDIGHGPFSHAMENSIVEDIHHEEISLLLMERLNEKFNGSLTIAIEIFKGIYSKKFMNQLVSGQLDMDRADYLRRDSFYTGVAEGNISSERLITMLNVVNNELVIEEKGIYSVEKFLIARRLMYWQVYLHKTSLVAEQLLIRVFKRAKELTKKGVKLESSASFAFFLENDVDKAAFGEEALEHFLDLDDIDVLSAMKSWQNHEDYVLSQLCKMILHRNLLRIKIKKQPIKKERLENQRLETAQLLGISPEEATYFVFTGTISNQAYNAKKQNINILKKSGKLVDVAQASDQLNLKALSNKVIKYFICHPKAKIL